ncbi:MAG: thiamine diphosphokinase, partial [Bacteroidales bacterium]|nr:thiamine diphosphokinase [Bacteroidales bacterium]
MTSSAKTTAAKTFIILCDGDFPSKGPARKLLEKAQKAKKSHTIISCDGAILSLLKNGMDADYIVGDMDTLPKKWQAKFKDKIYKENEQDFNDQTKAFRFALSLIEKHIAEKKASSYAEYRIIILGATGKREDHTLGNISYLPDYAQTLRQKFPKLKINISTVTDYGVFIPILDTTRLKGEPGDRISIFAFDHTLRIKSEGLEYKTDDVVFDMWWKATLNTFKKRDV